MPHNSNQKQFHRLTLGDTLTPLGLTLMQGGEPVDLDGKSVKVVGKKDDGSAWIAERTTGVTAQPELGFTVTASAASNRFAASNHRFRGGETVRFASSGDLPTGIEAETNYVVRLPSQHAFQVSLPNSMATLGLADSGSGTITCYPLGRVVVDFQPTDVDEAGTFWLWLKVYDDNGEAATFPMDGRKLGVEIASVT